MSVPSERAKQIMATEDIAAQNDETFGRIYNELDAFAAKIGGKAWIKDKLYEVEATRWRKIPTTRFGIEDECDFRTEHYEFTGKKMLTGDEEQPYYNAFYLARTVSAPAEFEELDPRHHSRLIDYFLDNFPLLMHEHFEKGEAGTDTAIMEDDTVDVDELDTADVIKICEKVLLDDIGEPLQLGKKLMYVVCEAGFIEYVRHNFCILGPGQLTLSEFDSSKRFRNPVHGSSVDNAAVEYGRTARDELGMPPRETTPDDTVERVLLEGEFDRITTGVFGENDLGGKPFLKHAKTIERMLGKLAK